MLRGTVSSTRQLAVGWPNTKTRVIARLLYSHGLDMGAMLAQGSKLIHEALPLLRLQLMR